MPKIIALAYSDIHINKFKSFNLLKNSRLKNTIIGWKKIAHRAKELKVPVLFAGDLFHTPKEVENETMAISQKTYHRYFEQAGVLHLGISGNHDMSERNGLLNKSPSHLKSFEHFTTFKNLDYRDFYDLGTCLVYGIPYMNNDHDLAQAIKKIKVPVGPKLKILLLHSDAPGAVTPLGFRVDETENIPKDLDKFFKGWDLVLFGHIHKPQRLSTKCYMLGATNHQDSGDAGISMGYWEVWSNGIMVHVPLNLPKFIKLKAGELDRGDGNYYIPYNEILAESEVKTGEFNISNSRSKLAKRYCALKNTKSKSKRRALIQILNDIE